MKTKTIFFSIVLVTVFSFSCKKESTMENIQAPTNNSKLKVKDDFSLVIGSNDVIINSINQTLDLTSSSKPYDSLIYELKISGTNRILIKVLKDRYFHSDRTFVWEKRGIYYTTLDSNILIGENCSTNLLAFKQNDTLNFNNLCTIGYTDKDDFYNQRFNNIDLGIVYDIHQENTSGGTTLRSWTGFPNSTTQFGEGYLSFRFLEGQEIKYGWVKLNIHSTLKISILEIGYMK